MQYRLNQNLGLDDARKINRDFGGGLPLDPKEIAAGQIIELDDKAVEYLTIKRGLSALLEPASKVRGQAKQSEVTAPAK